MKHKTLTFYFIGILLGFCSGYNLRSMRIQQQSRPERPYVPLYKYKGDKYSPTTLIKSHEYGYVPLDHIYDRKPNGLIPDAKTAARVGFAILSSIYGEEEMERQKPFDVYLFNTDECWAVCGTLPPNHIGGTAQILIQKSDGRVLNYAHYK